MWLNYLDMYAVSSDGEVKNRINGLYLTPHHDKEGRLRINIHGKVAMIHRIVADRFCPKIDVPGLEVDHINRDNTDNRASNLRWVDHSTNNRNKNSTNISKSGNRYRVKFVARGEVIYRNHFKTLEEAITARDNFISSL